jgi:hypothetical protein
MNRVSIIDDHKTSLFEFSISHKFNVQKKMFTYSHQLNAAIIDSGIIGGAEFELYINAFDPEHFDEELKSLLGYYRGYSKSSLTIVIT